MQCGTVNFVAGVHVDPVVVDVDRRRSPILLTDAVHAHRITKHRRILLQDVRTERTLAERIAEDGSRRAEEIALGRRLLLRQQTPRPVGLGESCIGSVPRFENRDHIEYGEPFHRIRMIQRQAIGDAPAAIVTDDRERRMAELGHDVDQLVTHRPLGVREVILRRLGCPAVPVGPQIDRDHRVIRGELRRYFPPHEARARKPVHQQNRRTVAVAAPEDRVSRDVNLKDLDIVEPIDVHPRRAYAETGGRRSPSPPLRSSNAPSRRMVDSSNHCDTS